MRSFFCKVTMLSIVALLTFCVNSSHADLVAYYTFDEGSGTTAADTAITYEPGDVAQNATQNQGTIGWTSSGLIGGALDLNGSSSLVVGGDPLNGTSAMTISLWVNVDDNPGYDGVFQSRNNENWGINIEGGSVANLHIDYRFDNPPVGTGGSQGIDSANGSVVAGDWEHVVMTWDDSGNGSVWLDGALVNSPSGLTTSYVSTTWYVGDDNCCGGRELNGQIDDIAVWDEVLSASDIAKIFADGTSANPIGAPAAIAVPEPSSCTVLAALGLLGLTRRKRS